MKTRGAEIAITSIGNFMGRETGFDAGQALNRMVQEGDILLRLRSILRIGTPIRDGAPRAYSPACIFAGTKGALPVSRAKRTALDLRLERLAQTWHICAMPKSAIVRARVDAKKKSDAESVLRKLGISLGDAVNMFLAQVSIQRGIPFLLTTRPHLDMSNATIEEIEERYADRVPNAVTRAALKESTRGAGRYKTASEVLKALKA